MRSCLRRTNWRKTYQSHAFTILSGGQRRSQQTSRLLPEDLELYDYSKADDRGQKCMVDAYGLNVFSINDHLYQGSVFLFPTSVFQWKINTIEELTPDHLALSYLMLPPVKILILGCGARMKLIHPEIRKTLRDKGIVIEAMDTPNAIATFNILNEEDRAVAAALVGVEEELPSPFL